jgi:hypothetical protein
MRLKIFSDMPKFLYKKLLEPFFYMLRNIFFFSSTIPQLISIDQSIFASMDALSTTKPTERMKDNSSPARSCKMSEEERRLLIFSDHSIEESLNHDCTPMKSTYPCPNDGKCKDKFSRSQGPGEIR